MDSLFPYTLFVPFIGVDNVPVGVSLNKVGWKRISN